MIIHVIVVLEGLSSLGKGKTYVESSPPLGPHPDYTGHLAIIKAVEAYIKTIKRSHDQGYKINSVSYTIIP